MQARDITRAKTDAKLEQDASIAQEMADYKYARAYNHAIDSEHAALFPCGTAVRLLLDAQHKALNPRHDVNLMEFVRSSRGHPRWSPGRNAGR